MPAAEPPPQPVTLNVNCIVGGVFFHAGTPTPYATEADLPASLKPFVASEAAPPPEPVERNIYDMPLSLKRQVGKLQLAAAEKAWAEEQASEPLPPETAAALEAKHELHIGTALAQAKYNDDAVDAVYEQAAATAQPQQLFVRRGGEMGHVERCRLKPGEHVFALRANGQYEAVGVVDSNGLPPPPEVIP